MNSTFWGLPPYPSKQTLVSAIGMSPKGQNGAHALQQMASIFDHLVGAVILSNLKVA